MESKARIDFDKVEKSMQSRFKTAGEQLEGLRKSARDDRAR